MRTKKKSKQINKNRDNPRRRINLENNRGIARKPRKRRQRLRRNPPKKRPLKTHTLNPWLTQMSS